MGCLGVHFAIKPELAERLLAATDDDSRMEIIGEVEEAWEREWLHECDKSWDGLHRSLTDGKLEWGNGAYPLNHVVLGGKKLMEEEGYIVCLVMPDQVKDIASALREVTRGNLRRGYDLIPTDAYPEVGDEDFAYTWDNFPDLPDLFSRASAAGRAVTFTASE
ncbi:MAG: YfbM family protein [Planctomycetota bacterium]